MTCAFCHGDDARGGDGGPNLLRSQIVLDDQKGELIGNVVHGQMYVSNFRLNNYPVHEEDILCTGPAAFSATATGLTPGVR